MVSISSSHMLTKAHRHTHTHTHIYIYMYAKDKLHTMTTLASFIISLTFALACSRSQAVLHGIQPAGNYQSYQPYEQQLQYNNKQGYRYNGPAHKYLPAEPVQHTAPEHWHYTNAETQPHQQSYEHIYGSAAAASPSQQTYQGPYNMHYYEQQAGEAHSSSEPQTLYRPSQQLQHQQAERFPAQQQHHHTATAAPTANVQLGPAYAVSGHAQSAGYAPPAAQLMTQALPEPQQRLQFAQLPAGDGDRDFMQMQSHSYQLPSSYHMQLEWPQVPTPQHQAQSHAEELPSSYHMQREWPQVATPQHQEQFHAEKLPSSYHMQREWPQLATPQKQQQYTAPAQYNTGYVEAAHQSAATALPQHSYAAPSDAYASDFTHQQPSTTSFMSTGSSAATTTLYPSRQFQPPYH